MSVLVLDDLRQFLVRGRLPHEPDCGMASTGSAAAQFHQVFGLQLRGRVFVFADRTKQKEVASWRNAEMIAVLQDQREAEGVEAGLDSLPAKIGNVGGEVDHADERAFGDLSEAGAGDFVLDCGNLFAEPNFANRFATVVDYADAFRFERSADRLGDRRLF